MPMTLPSSFAGIRRHWGKALLLVFLAGALAAVPFVGLGDTRAADAMVYHCPMHPSYTLDHPGDCPICGMRLVLVKGTAGAPVQAPAQVPAVYACPMDPEVRQSTPGRCPKCGMDLEKVAPGPATVEGSHAARIDGLAPVHATSEQFSLAGVRTTEAVEGSVTPVVRAVGNVVVDETRVRQVTTKIGGWVEKLHVNAVGQLVRVGDPLFDLYAPELLASQEEYLRARNTATEFERSNVPEVRRGGRDLAMAARRRLELFDVPSEVLERLDLSGTAQRTVSFKAPFGGHVTEKSILEGQRIESGSPVMTLTDFSRVWVVAQVYENEAASAALGRTATLSPQFDAGTRLTGHVALVYPTMDAESRTIRVRFEVGNPRLALKPGMFVNVELAAPPTRGVVIPDSALIDTGERQVVFVRASGGQFEPREVSAGPRADGQVVIARGLAAGETVAVSANFLLDSESRLRAALGTAPGVPDPGARK